MNGSGQRRTNIQQRIFLVHVATGTALLLSYIYFLSSSVVNVVMREEVERDIALLHSRIGALESEYIEKQHSVSELLSSRVGFIESKEKIFIDARDTTLSLNIE